MSVNRPKSLVAAIVLLLLGSVMIFLPLGGLVDLSEIPPMVLYSGYAMGLLGLAAAWLLWSSASRLGWWIGLIIALVDGLGAAPGILFAEDPGTRMLATTGTILRLATFLLLLLPSTRAAIGKGSAKAS